MNRNTRDELRIAVYHFAEDYGLYNEFEDEELDSFAYDFIELLDSQFDIRLKEDE